jgi:hypothetical protein
MDVTTGMILVQALVIVTFGAIDLWILAFIKINGEE